MRTDNPTPSSPRTPTTVVRPPAHSPSSSVSTTPSVTPQPTPIKPILSKTEYHATVMQSKVQKPALRDLPLRTSEINNFFDQFENEIAFAASILLNAKNGAKLPGHWGDYQPIRYTNKSTGEVNVNFHDYYKMNDRIYVSLFRNHIIGVGGFCKVKVYVDIETKECVAIKIFNTANEKGESSQPADQHLRSVGRKSVTFFKLVIDANSPGASHNTPQNPVSYGREVSIEFSIAGATQNQIAIPSTKKFVLMDYLGEDLLQIAQKKRIKSFAAESGLSKTQFYIDRLAMIPYLLATELSKIHDGTAFSDGKQRTHGDIKPLNILMQPNGSISFCDFGFSKMIGEDGTTCGDQYNTIPGTNHFLPPELLVFLFPKDKEQSARASESENENELFQFANPTMQAIYPHRNAITKAEYGCGTTHSYYFSDAGDIFSLGLTMPIIFYFLDDAAKINSAWKNYFETINTLSRWMACYEEKARPTLLLMRLALFYHHWKLQQGYACRQQGIPSDFDAGLTAALEKENLPTRSSQQLESLLADCVSASALATDKPEDWKALIALRNSLVTALSFEPSLSPRR